MSSSVTPRECVNDLVRQVPGASLLRARNSPRRSPRRARLFLAAPSGRRLRGGGDGFRTEFMDGPAERNKPILNSGPGSLGYPDLHFCPEVADLDAALTGPRKLGRSNPRGRWSAMTKAIRPRRRFGVLAHDVLRQVADLSLLEVLE
jgi:hypothetical protein